MVAMNEKVVCVTSRGVSPGSVGTGTTAAFLQISITRVLISKIGGKKPRTQSFLEMNAGGGGVICERLIIKD